MTREEVLARCTRFFGHPPKSARERLIEIAQSATADERPDRYGGGELLESFEREIAQLLGKEAAVFMPSGTMAQQIALRVHADRRNRRTVGLHPQSHLVVSENDALARLHGLAPIAIGDRNRLFGIEDLQALREPLGALLIELPERNIGGALRPWDDVTAMCAWARERGAAVHMDGARLWESQPFYARDFAALAAPFDTVYVSFYKILNAVSGAALAGEQSVIDEARGWQWRHGGRLVQQYPAVLSARDGLRQYPPRVPLYVQRAQAIAAILSEFEDVSVTPDPPPTNMMHVFVRGDRDALQASALRVSAESGVWLPIALQSTPLPDWQMFELTCGEGSLEISDAQVRELFAAALNRRMPVRGVRA